MADFREKIGYCLRVIHTLNPSVASGSGHGYSPLRRIDINGKSGEVQALF